MSALSQKNRICQQMGINIRFLHFAHKALHADFVLGIWNMP